MKRKQVQAEPLPIKKHFTKKNDYNNNSDYNNNKKLTHTCWKCRKGKDMRRCSHLKIPSCC